MLKPLPFWKTGFPKWKGLQENTCSLQKADSVFDRLQPMFYYFKVVEDQFQLFKYLFEVVFK